ncbi:MAG: SCP2 sterol-binding domain-containing protein [Candidatus Sedimenticola sp. (ex Thyasira tokunagai)]
MKNPINHLTRSPLLPRPFALPFGLIPTTAHSRVLVTLLNRIFTPELADGELDFLEGRVMRVDVVDARLSYLITLADGKLQAADNRTPHDLSIEGSIYDFLLLATRREDADTLFFNRRLRLGGDTELGLYVKNFLDALELDGRLGPVLKVLDGATSIIARIPELKLPLGKPKPVENSY